MTKRRIITLEIDESKLSAWGADWLRQQDIDFFAWVIGDRELPLTELGICGLRIIQDERRRPHVVRDWGSLDIGEWLIVADQDDMPREDFRRRQKQASAGATMASKRHAPKKFASRTRDGQVLIERVA